MAIYKFDGVVHPERVNFSLDTAIEFNLKFQDGTIATTIVKISDSKIFVTVDSAKDHRTDPVNLATLKNGVEETVRSVVDTYCYLRSYNYDVEIIRVTCEEIGIDHTFDIVGETNIKPSTSDTNERLTKILTLFSTEENVFLKDVFSDFRRSIKYGITTASHCYRAIETIRQRCFQLDGCDEKTGWERLRQAFGLRREDFDEILKFGVPNRHGTYLPITYNERLSIMNFTRKIIDQTIEMILGKK